MVFHRFSLTFIDFHPDLHGAEVCCSFLYLTPQGAAECRFMGAAQGSCELLLLELQANLSSSAFTRISNAQVLKGCSEDACNNPNDEFSGCPFMIDPEPAITDGIRPLSQAIFKVL